MQCVSLPNKSQCLCYLQSLCRPLVSPDGGTFAVAGAFVAPARGQLQLYACTRLSTCVGAIFFDPAHTTASSQARQAKPSIRAGSGLMLAMLLPLQFGVLGCPPVKSFGYPVAAALTMLRSDAPRRSGICPDNRRMQMLEALLSHWRDDAERGEVCDLLRETLMTLSHAMDLADPPGELSVGSVIRLALQIQIQ